MQYVAPLLAVEQQAKAKKPYGDGATIQTSEEGRLFPRRQPCLSIQSHMDMYKTERDWQELPVHMYTVEVAASYVSVRMKRSRVFARGGASEDCTDIIRVEESNSESEQCNDRRRSAIQGLRGLRGKDV